MKAVCPIDGKLLILTPKGYFPAHFDNDHQAKAWARCPQSGRKPPMIGKTKQEVEL